MHRLFVRTLAAVALAAAAGFVFAPSAFAYIDPGSGSYIIQIIAATFLGVLVAVGTFWRRIRAFFGRLFSSNKGAGD